ncbi:hypothetical protein M514_04396 [Trichuris suis]|uniref:Uncharacterized protein n=1 Tax=Trichuris suis TaxID=68888 RepID=A0A085MBV0_9BILA|nr:hypothetical protein M513_04396 [Trichuris suis]KFD64365.1 hypothetical protein M514_04396 [Trichuris suis]
MIGKVDESDWLSQLGLRQLGPASAWHAPASTTDYPTIQDPFAQKNDFPTYENDSRLNLVRCENKTGPFEKQPAFNFEYHL